jgi:hypothetical protein
MFGAGVHARGLACRARGSYGYVVAAYGVLLDNSGFRLNDFRFVYERDLMEDVTF